MRASSRIIGTKSSATELSLYNTSLAMHLDAGDTASYPGSGTTWTDLSGNGRNATIYGSPVYSSSNGGYFNLDGVNDYFSISQVNSQIITVATALYLEPYPAGNTYKYYVIIRQGYSPINYSMYLDNYQYKPYFIGTNTSVGDWPASGYNFTTGSWKYVVATFNWTNYSYKLYINGVSVVSSTWNSTNSGTYVFNNGSQGYNYTDISRNIINNNSFIYGKMALFKIYTSELTQDQITQNYNFYKSRFGF